MNNFKVAAAVALALGGTAAAQSALAAPTAAQCAAATATLYIAGSSAAQPSFATALANDLFDSGGETTIAAPAVSGSANGNFKAYCGAAKAGNGAGVATGAIVTVYYRGEGGSVVGALPIVSGKPIKFLDLSSASCQVTNPSVVGLSSSVGTTDGWTGCVSQHAVEMGVTDVEPGQFHTPNYPSAYSTSVFGSATQAQLAGLTKSFLFQQVFGLFVNTSGFNGAGGATGQAVDLSRETAAAIMSGNYSDWSAVPTASGGQVSTTSQPITIVNREAGSGSRTGMSIYLLGTNCVSFPLTLSDPSPANDGYATGDVIATAGTTPGAITYASIDNQNKPGLSTVSLSGVAPSNLAATNGKYDWWFEATAQKGTITSPGGTGIYNWLIGGELANIATAPHVIDILAIPNVGTNTAAVPVTASTVGGVTIYINPFSKGGNSCSYPAPNNF